MFPIAAIASSVVSGASGMFGSGMLGKAAGGLLGGGSNPLASFFGGLQSMTGGLLGRGGEAMLNPQPLPPKESSQQGLMGVIDRLVSLLSNVVSGLMSRLTGSSPAAPTPAADPTNLFASTQSAQL